MRFTASFLPTTNHRNDYRLDTFCSPISGFVERVAVEFARASYSRIFFWGKHAFLRLYILSFTLAPRFSMVAILISGLLFWLLYTGRRLITHLWAWRGLHFGLPSCAREFDYLGFSNHVIRVSIECITVALWYAGLVGGVRTFFLLLQWLAAAQPSMPLESCKWLIARSANQATSSRTSFDLATGSVSVIMSACASNGRPDRY